MSEYTCLRKITMYDTKAGMSTPLLRYAAHYYYPMILKPTALSTAELRLTSLLHSPLQRPFIAHPPSLSLLVSNAIGYTAHTKDFLFGPHSKRIMAPGTFGNIPQLGL
jgi:hypothetical protein